MRTIFSLTAFVIVLITFLSSSSYAQFQLTTSGSRLTFTNTANSLDQGRWGAGATARYFIKPRLAVGLNTRYYVDRSVSTYGMITSRSKISLAVITGQGEYFLTTSALQPYVGLEAGLYRVHFNLDYIGQPNSNAISTTSALFSIGPKAGLHYTITPRFGLNLDASYQILLNRNFTSSVLFTSLGAFVKFGKR